MSSILDVFASDGFAEVAEANLFEEALAIKRGYIKKRHGERRSSCYKCGGLHTASEHRSHGPGSFCRTHPKHKSCR